ncbi:MAG: 3-deoxy-7-phosphoheptulonate synthase [Oscillospiraceae bacterium]|nr:3-deoxy-7-phosphoheptulonate synthase [Oscillospiraceae bacterium]
MSMNFERKLPIPMEVKEKYPVTYEASKTKEKIDREIAAVFRGESSKKILVIGPCSADREDAVFEYCTRLKKMQEKCADKLILIPRIYTNKPRTTGDGYKGMLHQPDPNKRPDPFNGLLAIRALHAKVLTELGMPTADEMLYPANHRYLSDLLSYVAVGARSSENQEHRLVSSGFDVPVGMKNPTGGDLSVMMNSITAAQHAHTFIYRGWEVNTSGNELSHAILRGYMNKHGQSLPNYHYEDLAHLCEMYAKTDLKNPAVIVDTNHANSGKKYDEQPRICKEVLHSCRHNSDIAKIVKGFMIESYLEDGCQKIGAEEVFGQSITDPCLGWEKTEKLINDIAELV